MRTVELVPGLRSSVLGFGCAPILGSISGRQAKVALELALELGVTHLDVAPSYGFGQAENWLGKFLEGRREEVVLATKFGLEATKMARLLTPAKPFIRLIKKIKRDKKKKSQKEVGGRDPRLGPGRFFYRANMNSLNLEQSVERSLRALRTDRIDILLLHEPPRVLPQWGELRAKAEQLKCAGKIRAFGVAYNRHGEHPDARVLQECEVRQFDCPPADENYETIVKKEGYMPSVLFSPFSKADEKSNRELVLRRIFRDFSKSVVLCSMFCQVHIKKNVEIADERVDTESR